MTLLYRMTGGVLEGSPGTGGPAPQWHPVFGTAVTAYPGTGRSQAQEFALHVQDCGPPGCHRVYDGVSTFPTTWTSVASGAATYSGWQDRWIWVSLKPDMTQWLAGSLDVNFASLMASVPASKPGIKILWTFWHEPEAKVKPVGSGGPGLFTAAQWKQGMYRFAQKIRALGRSDFLVGPVFMSKFTIATAVYGVQALWDSDPADLPSVCDFIGWDPYNEDSAQNNYAATFQGTAGVEYYWTDVVVWTQNHAPGLPVAIGETSFLPDETNLQRRVDWINAVEQFAVGQRFLACCWFDAQVTAEPPWLLRVYEPTRGSNAVLNRDQPSIDAWAGVYARHPLSLQGAGL